MVAASVGASVASDLGFSTAFAEPASEVGKLSFGKLEPLVAAMCETPPEKLQQVLVAKLRRGETNLKDLTAAAALAGKGPRRRERGARPRPSSDGAPAGPRCEGSRAAPALGLRRLRAPGRARSRG